MDRSRLRNAKIVIAGIATQSLCLAVGLAVQYRYICASATGHAEHQARTTMKDQWGNVLARLTPGPVEDTCENWRTAIQRALSAGRPDGPSHIAVTDSRGRLIYADPQADCAATLPEHSVFAPTPSEGESPSQALTAGMFMLADQEHPALGWARPGGGYVVVYTPLDDVRVDMASLLDSLPAISGLTWLWTSALLAISSYLILAKFHERSSRDLSRAESEGFRQRQHLVRTRDAVIFGLAKLAESRDSDTGDHLERISLYSTTLAQALSKHPKYANVVTPMFVRNLGASSVLHDIGKVGIEDRILLKPGRYTASERTEMESHCRIAADCLREIEQRLGRSNFLEMAREIALCHHERWDGSGYPAGLRGEDIPLSARIVAIVDVYDALASRRVYKDPKPHEECVSIIRAGTGTQFDPDLVEIWLTLADRFGELCHRYAETNKEEGEPAGLVKSRRASAKPGADEDAELATASKV